MENIKIVHVGLSMKQYAYLNLDSWYLIHWYTWTCMQDCHSFRNITITIIFLFESKCNNLLFDLNICI